MTNYAYHPKADDLRVDVVFLHHLKRGRSYIAYSPPEGTRWGNRPMWAPVGEEYVHRARHMRFKAEVGNQNILIYGWYDDETEDEAEVVITVNQNANLRGFRTPTECLKEVIEKLERRRE
jgi:hypothetical protein